MRCISYCRKSWCHHRGIVSPQMRVYKRFNTVVVVAYIKPLMKSYVDRLEGRLRNLIPPLLATTQSITDKANVIFLNAILFRKYWPVTQRAECLIKNMRHGFFAQISNCTKRVQLL